MEHSLNSALCMSSQPKQAVLITSCGHNVCHVTNGMLQQRRAGEPLRIKVKNCLQTITRGHPHVTMSDMPHENQAGLL